jgi:poly(beta-D-mannuronate) lyase
VDGRSRRIGILVVALVFAVAAPAACSRPTPAPPPPPVTAWTPAPRGSAQYPGQVIDLTDWYLTLPTGEERNPDDVYQPELNTFTNPWFHLNDSRDGIVFTANVGGVTTKGSTYPRSELREMNGSQKASWSNTTGTHALRLRQAVIQLPAVKPHVVTSQIHDATDDVIEVRLEGRHLSVQYDNGGNEITLDSEYVLGTTYDLDITASRGHIQVFYNGTQKGDIAKSGSGWYFKTGSYVQSNTSRGDAPAAVGQVVLYALDVQHSP